MSEESWQRARRPEQKRERRDSILSAAVELLDEQGLEATSLSAIARAVGISKASLYRYFESREAILLEVTLDETRTWIEAVEHSLEPLAGSDDVDAVADTLARSLATRPRLCELLSSLSSVFEHNVGVEVIVDFKRRFAVEVEVAVAAVVSALPRLSPADARVFTTLSYLFVAGAWPASHPAPAVAEVLAREEFADMCVEFEDAIRVHARTLLLGLVSASGS